MAVIPASQEVLGNVPTNAGKVRYAGSIPGSKRSLGGERGSPLQYSCLENPTDRGACRLQSIASHRVRHS